MCIARPLYHPGYIVFDIHNAIFHQCIAKHPDEALAEVTSTLRVIYLSTESPEKFAWASNQISPYVGQILKFTIKASQRFSS